MNLYRMARRYAENLDIATNHLYDGKPYKIHLDMVEDVAKEFLHLVPNKNHHHLIRAAIRCHDLIEDDRASYNDVVENANKFIADIVFAVSNEKGKTRAERANDKYYAGIRATEYATFIKLCDRIANIRYGIENNGKWKMYRREHAHFKRQLYDDRYKAMFDHIENQFIDGDFSSKQTHV
jgi:(p)ppGpp synthase/HD superfamily hydrolase